MENYTICSLLSNSVEKYADRIALSYVDEAEGITYASLGIKVSNLAGKLASLDIGKGDKVAIIGESSPDWGIAYLSILCLGAVAVPILPDFHVDEVVNIIRHSEAKLAFISSRQNNRLKNEFEKIEFSSFILDDLKISGTEYDKKIYRSICLSCLESSVKEEDLATIIYTSGTTGTSKGVMLTHKNITWMARQSLTIQDVNEHDRFLSILPLAHTYENSLGFLLPLMSGSSIYYLKKQPTPTVLLEALQKIKPTTLLTVPLIIEKIYRKQVLPKFKKSPITRALFNFKPSRRLLNYLAGKKLKKVFGGNIRFFGIGGAKLDAEIEQYLREARFPYAIGYGLTETSPMLAGCNPQNTKLQSTGKVMEGVTLRLDNVNPETGEGEIVAKGPNVMQGYYKNPEATKAVFTEDGWFKTGDLAYIDKKGFIYIRGRIKNVILGTNGENIYPEEIESIFNSIDGIEESLVIQKHGKIVAMVNMNLQELENKIIRLNEKIVEVKNEKIDEVLFEIQKFVNSKVNRFSQIQLVVLHAEPFEKTPTKKIKRYLYGG
jgi:long-chain acyl-CoA synthetase